MLNDNIKPIYWIIRREMFNEYSWKVIYFGVSHICRESLVSAVLKAVLIRLEILPSEFHCDLTLRPHEVDQTSNTAAPLQDSWVRKDVESLRISDFNLGPGGQKNLDSTFNLTSKRYLFCLVLFKSLPFSVLKPGHSVYSLLSEKR